MPPVMVRLWQSLTDTFRVRTLRFLIIRMTPGWLTVVLSGMTTPGLTMVLIVVVIAPATATATGTATTTGARALPGLSDVHLYGTAANRGITNGNGTAATC
jgi:hypothetical protein